MPLTNDALQSELVNDPEHLGYADAADADAKATKINAKTIVAWHTLPKHIVLDKLIAMGVWPAIEVALLTPNTPIQVSALCATAKTYYSSGQGDVDAQDPTFRANVTGFQSIGLLTADQVTAFYANFQILISRAEQLGGTGTVVPASQITAAHNADAIAATQTMLEHAGTAYGEVLILLQNSLLALQDGTSSATVARDAVIAKFTESI